MTCGYVTSIYIIGVIVVAIVTSHPSSPYTGTEVMRRTLFWPLYAFSWLVHNLMKAFREAWSNEDESSS